MKKIFISTITVIGYCLLITGCSDEFLEEKKLYGKYSEATVYNNYETAQLIGAQTRDLMQMNYTNQINVVQGFNAIQQSLSQLGYQMDQCC